MVMHARKIQRLNDGYYDRGSTHPFEDKGSSKGRDSQYNNKYSRKDSSSLDKHSPRYINKSSYKDRHETGKSRSPEVDRRANHHSGHKDTSSSSSRHSNHLSSSRSSSGTVKDKKVDKDHKIEIHKSALRICLDWSEHLSSSGKRYYYNYKTEVSKWEKPKDWIDEKAVRTEYGRRKEVQAQKPVGQERSKHSSSSTTNSHPPSRYNQADRSTISNDRDKQYKSSSRSSANDSRGGDYRDKNYSSSTQRRKDSGGGVAGGSGGVAQSALSALQNPRVLQRYNDTENSVVKDRPVSSGGGDSSKLASSSYRDKYGRLDRGGSSTPRSQQGSVTPGTTEQRDRDAPGANMINNYSRQSAMGERRHPEDSVNRQQEDMDISPGSTPTEESMARGLSNMLPQAASLTSAPQQHPHHQPATSVSSAANPVLASVAALPQLISQIGDKAIRGISSSNSQTNPQGNAKLNTAIQTLQKLQEALIAQQRAQQHQLATLLQEQIQRQTLPNNQLLHGHASRSNGGVLAAVAPGLLSPGIVGSEGLNHNGAHAAAIAQLGQQPPSVVTAVSSPYLHGHPSSHISPAVSAAMVLSSSNNTSQQQHHPHNVSPSLHNSNSHNVVAVPHTDTTSTNNAQHSAQTHAQPLFVVTENGGQSPGAESAGTPLCSPELNLPDDSLHLKTDTEKDTSQEDARLGSPAASQSSSQKATTGLAAATLTRQDSYKLPPSLANFYREDLIQHVAHWPMEIIEKQADQIKNDSHTVGSLYSTQVSCELKKARSLVRVSEIQSTLQEQRVLFIRQQIKDLEGFRNTNASFMSPKQGR